MSAFQRATAWIDAGAIERNAARLAGELDEGCRLCAVVKANGYGHGMAEAAEAAVAGGAAWLGVATAGEAFELRARMPRTPILVMGALTEPEVDVALGAVAEVAVWREEFLEQLAAAASRFEVTPRVHVKYDTGMGRLGAKEPALVERLLERAAGDERVVLRGLWTHFATADDPGDPFLAEQLERFGELAARARERHGELLVHAANSAATLHRRDAHFDMVRCGIALYGLDPFGSDPAEQGLEPALGLASYVADVKRFHPGESAGYGRTWRAAGETDLAVVPIGYGDGVRRALSNDCEVLIGGRRYPVVGTISMDNLTVELGAGSGVRPGDEVVLLGAQAASVGGEGEERILAEEWARRLATINYEVTCGIGPRVPRVRRG
jgi:alanine racemase